MLTAAGMLVLVFAGCFFGSALGSATAEHLKAELLRIRLHRAAQEQMERKRLIESAAAAVVEAMPAQRVQPVAPARADPPPPDVVRWRFMAPPYQEDAAQGG